MESTISLFVMQNIGRLDLEGITSTASTLIDCLFESKATITHWEPIVNLQDAFSKVFINFVVEMHNEYTRKNMTIGEFTRCVSYIVDIISCIDDYDERHFIVAAMTGVFVLSRFSKFSSEFSATIRDKAYHPISTIVEYAMNDCFVFKWLVSHYANHRYLVHLKYSYSIVDASIDYERTYSLCTLLDQLAVYRTSVPRL